MASGAGLNRWGPSGGVPFFFSVDGKGIAHDSPQTLGASGSVDSGPIAVEAIGFSKWAFQLCQEGATPLVGYSAQIYGTIHPAAYRAWQAKIQGLATVTVPASAWFPLPAPSEQSGTGTSTNPITATGVVLPYNLSPLVAVRCVLTTNASGAGTAQVFAFGIP